MLYLVHLHYLVFMKRNLQNGKKLMSIQIINDAGMDSKNIVNNAYLFNEMVSINKRLMTMLILIIF